MQLALANNVGKQALGHIFRYQLLLPMKTTNTALITLMQYKHQASKLLSMNNYNPLVISRNDKNNQLTLLANTNWHLPQKINFLYYKIIRAPK
jgi:hypothetical protein